MVGWRRGPLSFSPETPNCFTKKLFYGSWRQLMPKERFEFKLLLGPPLGCENITLRRVGMHALAEHGRDANFKTHCQRLPCANVRTTLPFQCLATRLMPAWNVKWAPTKCVEKLQDGFAQSCIKNKVLRRLTVEIKRHPGSTAAAPSPISMLSRREFIDICASHRISATTLEFGGGGGYGMRRQTSPRAKCRLISTVNSSAGHCSMVTPSERSPS